MPATADWRDDLKVLRIGTLAPPAPLTTSPGWSRSAPTAGSPRPAGRDRRHATTPRSSTPKPARVQYAIHSASSYATAEALCACVEPIALPTAFDGSHGFHAVLVAHADSAIASLADARGKRLALTGADSVAGRLVPLKALAGQGIDPQTISRPCARPPTPNRP